MKVVCVGGGPGGLYTAIALTCRDPQVRVTVLDRDPEGTTYGWGVVFWDDLLDTLFATDPVSARAVADAAVVWDGQQVRVAGRGTAHLGGYGYGVGRARLLALLTARARELGVDVRFGCDVDPAEVPDADVVVAADGVHSGLRQRHADVFGPHREYGRNRYVWLGTPARFDAFTFAFEPTRAGWLWCHAYAYEPGMSTVIVECTPETWEGLGLDRLGPEETARVLGDVFADHLGGAPLLVRNPAAASSGSGPTAQGSPWTRFTHVRNGAWTYGNLVLLGDAAHTTHFSLGSGTRLAVEDAVSLADRLVGCDDPRRGLEEYAGARRAVLEGWQREGLTSARWFERVPGLLDRSPARVAYALLHRCSGSDDGLGAPQLGPWRHGVHVATLLGTQLTPLRRLRRVAVTEPRRRRRARRREGAHRR